MRPSPMAKGKETPYCRVIQCTSKAHASFVTPKNCERDAGSHRSSVMIVNLSMHVLLTVWTTENLVTRAFSSLADVVARI